MAGTRGETVAASRNRGLPECCWGRSNAGYSIGFGIAGLKPTFQIVELISKLPSKQTHKPIGFPTSHQRPRFFIRRLSDYVAGLPPNAENQANIKQKMQDWDVFFRCRNTALIEMQSAAFERENDAILMEKCRPFPPLAPEEISTLKAFLRKGANVAPEEASVRIQLLEKADTYNQCKNENKLALLISVMKNWSDELGASKRAARPQTVNGSDANGLSSGPMAP
jgi:hypothetical protein